MTRLTFAKVTRLVLDSTNLINRAENRDDEIYSHFCGFAETEKGETIWFKKSSFRPVFIAGVTHQPPLELCAHYPHRGCLLVGEVTDSPRGKMFSFWSHHAEPIRAFERAVQAGPDFMQSADRSYPRLRTTYTRGKTHDDLWLLARLYLMKDVQPFCLHLTADGSSGTTALDIERNVEEFVFFAAFFARDVAILKDFLKGIESGDSAVQSLGSGADEKYSVRNLEKMMEQGVA